MYFRELVLLLLSAVLNIIFWNYECDYFIINCTWVVIFPSVCFCRMSEWVEGVRSYKKCLHRPHWCFDKCAEKWPMCNTSYSVHSYSIWNLADDPSAKHSDLYHTDEQLSSCVSDRGDLWPLKQLCMELNCDILQRFRGLFCSTKVMYRSVLISVVVFSRGTIK